MLSVQIHSDDNVKVALEGNKPGHKFAIKTIKKGENVIKYGMPIGYARQDIAVGDWVHTHNAASNLNEKADYSYNQRLTAIQPVLPESFLGFPRKDGSVGTRNEVWVIPTVGCVNGVVERLSSMAENLIVKTTVEGVYAFTHSYGCSQMGDDHETTKRLLATLTRHPNAGAVLVVGLGCENNTMEQFKAAVGEWDDMRVKFLVCQEVSDEIAAGTQLLIELIAYAGSFSRKSLPVSKLIVGLKCGGSDGFSGITANPLVGRFSDMLIARGGSSILTEVPEMFGAEEILLNRAVSREVYDKAAVMITKFKEYFTAHGQVVYENPSPGNKQGGITTLEEKSLGCVQKGGITPVCDVIGYADRVTKSGLTLLSGPGNDLVSATALAAAGANLILFTTGRGTPLGTAVPVVKIATNTGLSIGKPNWVDFNAGTIVEGEDIAAASKRLLDFVIETASGKKTKTEINRYREIAIFKDGVTL
jgi:altronate hydrolase